MKTLFKLFYVCFLIAVSTYSFYVGGTFFFLSSPLFERVVTLGPNKGKIEIKRGWSWIPGQVELKDVGVEIEDPNIHLWIRIPHAKAQIQLKELFKKHLTLDKVETPAEHKAYLENEKHLKEVGPKKTGSADLPWLITLMGVELNSVDELAVDSWVFHGQAHIRGAFRLLPGIRAEIFPCLLHIDSGKIPGLASEAPRAGEGSIQSLFCS